MSPHRIRAGLRGLAAITAMFVALALSCPPALADVRCVQESLSQLGYDPGPIDGALGPRTARAAANIAIDFHLDLPRLSARTSEAWCKRLHTITFGAGAVPLDPKMIAPGAAAGSSEPDCAENPPPGYARRIRGLVDGDELTLTVSSRFGGAVDSLTWRGKEFINIYDHGRQISYAWSMDGWGECLNPTEPGSAGDLFKQSSTSKLLSVCSRAPNQLTTLTRPAYWLAPGESGFCDRGARSAVNDTLISDHRLKKSIEIGYGGIDNVIAFDATVTLPRDYESNQLEVPTAYLAHDFTTYYRFNPATGELTKPESDPLVGPWSFVSSGSKIPPIIATPDGKYAMGAYTADPLKYYEILFYDVANPADRTNKWNIVMREEPAPAGDYHYLSFAVVGTLKSVQEAMRALYQLHPTDFKPPEGYVDVASCREIAGWAWDPKAPGRPVKIEIHDLREDGTKILVAKIDAQYYRPDLPPVLGDNGRHGYSIATDRIFPRGGHHKITVEAVNSVRGLPNRTLIPAVKTLDCPTPGK
jgi:hypothetical protein